jgi:ribulose-phosphate 3-epimerase
MKVAPSVLAADFTSLRDIVKQTESWGVDALHMDIMDGEFCPNLTYGPKIVKTFSDLTSLPLYCHLMIIKPERYAEAFLKAGGAVITPHLEAVRPETLKKIQKIAADYDAKFGIAIKIETPFSAIPKHLHNELDELMIMSVPPGFSYQKFNPSILPKVKEASNTFKEKGLDVEISVDGGVNLETAPLLVDAGVNLLVAGGAIFGDPEPAKVVQTFKEMKPREKE